MVNKPEKTRPRLFLIDGYALIYRSFFAMISRPLTTSRGENTSAAWGVAKFLLKVLEEHDPDYLGIVMDAGTSQREERYPAYKATREKMPDDLNASLPRIEQLLNAFRIPILRLDNHEADDVIGTLAFRAVEQNVETVIVSGDKDFYQLVRDGICLLNPGRGGPAGVEEEWVDLRNASERLGVPPEHVTDYLALIGDSSDNIPGAKGIGPKTAIQLIEKFGTVEEILAHAHELGAKRARESLLEHAEDVRLSKELVTIMTDLPIPLELEKLRRTEPDHQRLRSVFVELEFHSLAREVLEPDVPATSTDCEYHLIRNVDEVEALVGRARERGQAALGVETGVADPLRGSLVGMSISVEPGTSYYLPFAHRKSTGLELEADPPNLPSLDDPALQPLRDLLADPGVEKVGHDLKRILLVLRRAGVALRGLAFDTMVASYLLDPGRREHTLDSLCLQFLNHRTLAFEEVCGKGKEQRAFEHVDLERARDFACQASELALRLRVLFEPDLQRAALDGLYREMELPLIAVLAEMEWRGIRIDEPFFRETAIRLERDLRLIEEEIYKEAGEEFNINSTPKLREVLFDRLQLPVVKKTKTGASTDASVLEALAEEGHRLPRLILEYRQLDKLKGTYVDALPQMVNPDTHRIHTTFNQTVAATGRLSSNDPNLQNIPIRTERGAELRKGFVPGEGSVFLAADYSQIELRILAHLSGDPAFVEAFRSGVDIHRQTAALVFEVGADAVTPQMRNAAKTINFATIYGIGPFALAQKLGTSVQEAKRFIEQYFERFTRVRAYLDEQVARAKKLGYVETISGRRRYIPEVRSSNFNIRQFGERAATNAPVQGSAADIIKIAMIRIHDALQETGARSRMLVQVHDELLLEVPEEELQETRNLVRDRMVNAFPMDVPLDVEMGVGKNWFECK